MNKKEARLIAELLEMAANEFCNHGCNDVDKEVFKDWTLEEKKKLIKEFCEYNGNPNESEMYELSWLGDSTLMALFAHKLKIESL